MTTSRTPPLPPYNPQPKGVGEINRIVAESWAQELKRGKELRFSTRREALRVLEHFDFNRETLGFKEGTNGGYVVFKFA